jgi:hypothetical protein
MENGTSILSSLTQKGSPPKNQVGFNLSPAQAEVVSAKFGEVLQNALQAGKTKLMFVGELGQDTALLGLEQKIMDLSAKTEGLLLNADPEAVEDILAQSVEQLWELIENLDIQNGTQHVLELSESLTTLALIEADTQDLADIAGLFSGAFTQPTNLLAAETLVSEIPTATGLAEVQSLVAVQGQPLVAAQGQPQTDETPLFTNVINLLRKPQSFAQDGIKPASASRAVPNVPALNGLELVTKTVVDWPQQVQQLTIETPLNRHTLENTVAGKQVLETGDTAGKANADKILLVGGNNIKAKEILTFSAQTIISNANAPAVTNEISGHILHAKTELQSVNTAVPPEPPRPARSFSQNVASQLQGKPLNEGITRIELAPRGLGNIIIELKTKETGDIQIIVKAENSAVIHALRTDRDALLSTLSNEVSTQDAIDLEFEEFSDGQFNHEDDGVNWGETVNQADLDNEDSEGLGNASSATQKSLGVDQIDILT